MWHSYLQLHSIMLLFCWKCCCYCCTSASSTAQAAVVYHDATNTINKRYLASTYLHLYTLPHSCELNIDKVSSLFSVRGRCVAARAGSGLLHGPHFLGWMLLVYLFPRWNDPWRDQMPYNNIYIAWGIFFNDKEKNVWYKFLSYFNNAKWNILNISISVGHQMTGYSK